MRAANERVSGTIVGVCTPSAKARWWIAPLLGALLLLFPVVPAHAAIGTPTSIGTNVSRTNNGTSLVVTSTAAVAAGNTVIVTFSTKDNAIGTISCVDSVGNTYSLDVDTAVNTTMRTAIFSTTVTNAIAIGTTITVTHPSSDRRLAAAFSVTGIASPRLDTSQKAASDVNSTTASSGATPATAQADELLIGSFGIDDRQSPFTPLNSFTSLGSFATDTGGGNEPRHGTSYRIVSATGAYTAAATISNHHWAAAIATYKGGSSCGNSVVDGVGETCDLGAQNGVAGSCCSATCTFVTVGTLCRASAGDCDPQELCTGASATCPVDTLAPNLTACTSDGNACTLDQCNGASALCQHPAGNAGAVCLAAAGECDLAETCTGSSTTCPADVKKPNLTACTDDGNVCSLDQCNGSSALCQHPAGNAGTECFAAAGECDLAETCTGSSTTCPADAKKPNLTACTDDGNVCSLDQCNGSSALCQHPAGNAGAECRAAGGDCDLAESCTGVSTTCPADAKKLNGTECRAAAGECDLAESCDGTGVSCPADAKKANLTACTTDGNLCSLDQCDGASDLCQHPAGNLGTECRASTDDCDPAEACDGASTSCPSDQLDPEGTACTSDGVPCTTDACNNAGVCTHDNLDADGDLVCDSADNCPTVSNAGQVDTDNDNIGDACECLSVTCPPLDCHDAGVCNSTTGSCDYTAHADGTSCDDGDACSTDDACAAGACVGVGGCGDAHIRIPALSVTGPGTDIVVPITFDPADGVAGADIVMTYDPSVLTATGVYLTSFTNGWFLVPNLSVPGTVRIGLADMFTGPALTGTGQVVWIAFHVVGPAGTSSPLTFTQHDLNEGEIPSVAHNGIVSIAASDVVIAMPDDANGAPGTTVDVPISLNPTASLNTFSTTVTFNPDVLDATAVNTTSPTSGWSVSSNLSTPGTAIISMSGTALSGGAEDVATVTFNVTGGNGDQTPLDIVSGATNPGVTVTLDDGLFTVCPDADSDGYTACGGDCDDTSDRTFPGAAPLDSATACMKDVDQDGYGDTTPPPGVTAGTDCQDAVASVHPGVSDLCNGIDDDCDASTDEDYVVVTSCFLPGACAAGNVASSCTAGTETACATGTPAADDATCDGIDDDCDASTDEDYVVVTSCYLPGECAAGNAPSTCVAGVETSCATGTPAANDANCNGLDEDCSGASDEDYLPVTSCYLPGECAAGNTPSSCTAGVETSCATGTPAANDANCNGLDEDCSGASDEDYLPVTSCYLPGECAAGNAPSTCVAGVETACATGTPAANDANCNGLDEDCSGASDEDYLPVTSCYLPGECAAGNAPSTCVAGVETACATGTPAANDANCNGLDEDCSGASDEDYLPVTSCFLPGTCAAGNVASSCTAGVETSCATGTPAANDANCNGLDEDCSGASDEDYLPVTSCYLPGECAAGNAPSTCVAGVETACATGTPAANDANCNGLDEDCSGASDEDYLPVTSCYLPGECAAGNTPSSCTAGVETSCATGTPAANDANCNGLDEDCSGASDEDYLPVTSCYLPGECAAGNTPSSCTAGVETSCATGTPAANDANCNGLDEDCSGASDEDYLPVTSCYLPGECAAGNAPSTCVAGVETACATGTPAANDANCNGLDEDCSGASDEDYLPVTSCYLPGECAAGNAPSTCVAGVETACATGTPAANDANCNGLDEDCSGASDEDYLPVTSCFLPGTCAAGNVASSCTAGVETSCATGTPAANDANCNGLDEDCSGASDEDYLPVTSCFLPGTCAAGNVASSCTAGTETACATGTPAANDANCNGLDEDCSGASDEDYLPVTSCFLPGTCAAGNVASSCTAGTETACATGTPAANDTNCNGLDEDCSGASDEDYLPVTSCYLPGECAAGNAPSTCVAGVETACATGTPVANDANCNGLDEDCSGASDEDYLPVTSCFLPGTCAAGNVASSCTAGVETACATGTPAANDANCNGLDEDCSGASDEDYLPVTSCFLPGTCAAGNVASSCTAGTETACATGTPAANDANCNGLDEDCSGASDEDYLPVTSCFLPGTCAAGNVASSCTAGVETACATGTPAANDANCNGLDEDCSGASDEDYLPVTSCYLPGECAAGNAPSSCVAGVETACATGTPAANDANCNGLDEDCSGASDEDYLPVTSCFLPGTCAAGNVASSCTAGVETSCATGTPAANDANCNGLDEDCSGASDEDYLPVTSCFLPGTCAAGNVASSCTAGVETSCATGTPAANDANCNGLDEDCSGASDEDYLPVTSCYLPGECAAGNAPSTCVAGVETACATGTPAANDANCNGLDEDCSGASDEDYLPVTSCYLPGECAAGNTPSSCTAGVETSCATGTPAANDANCNGLDEDCSGASDEDYLPVTSCYLPGECAAGNTPSSCTAGVETSCATGTPAANDANCNGLDEDCSGASDEDYLPVTSCYLPGECAAGNAPSTCVAGVETACATGTPAANDANCNGLDEDCSGASDEDYLPVTSCYLPGECAAGNAPSTCVAGTETACATGTPAANDANCNGLDEDCSGASDEDYLPVTSCFLPGTCAAGNVASSCTAGTETACATGTPAANDANCNGLDEDCSGASDEDYLPVTSCYLPGECAAGNAPSTCVAGTETSCATGTPAANDANCNGLDEDCSGASDEDYLPVTSCFLPGTCAAGNVASSCTAGVETSCSTGTPAANDANCNGLDEDCSGASDEDYLPVTSCYLPGECAAGNAPSTCVAGVETACATGTPAANDANCNGLDEDCSGASDEDYLPVTSCFLPGTCAAGNVASSCTAGTETSCATGTPAANDANCNGLDEDCSGASDEDYLPVTSCYLPGECAAGNAPSTCVAGVETSCATGTPAANDANCNGLDEDCSGASDEDYLPVTSCYLPGECAAGNAPSTCVAGVETSCATGTPAANDANCNGLDEDCSGASDEDYLPVTSCYLPGECAAGNAPSTCVAGVETACATGTPAANDANCNGLDEDCSGASDEDYLPVTSCFLPGTCAAGNVASSCTAGTETACATGTPAANDANCNGLDEDCSGASDEDYLPVTSCFLPGTCAAGNAPSTCVAGVETACATGTPAAETCNGLDDDCNGQVDDGLGTISCGVGTCSNTVPACVAGQPNTCTPPNGTACDDGNACTTTDTCAGGTCVGGSALNCNDSNPCTDDSCAQATGCVNVPNTASCNDGLYCTENDTCGGGSCHGTAKVCAGGSLCASATCDENTDQCVLQASGLCGVSGNVKYYRDATGAGSEPSAKPVPNVGIDSTGDATAEATTDTNGGYALSSLSGNVTVKTLPKYGSPRASDHNDAVSSFDATLIARHSVQLITLTGKQQLAGDVSGNGVVTAFDAGLVSKFVAQQIDHLPVATTKSSDWEFLRCDGYPTCTNPTYSYTPLTGPAVADFYAVLFGDVSGNWEKATTLVSSRSSSTTDLEEVEAIESDRALATKLAGAAPILVPTRTGAASVFVDNRPSPTKHVNQKTVYLSVGNAAGIQGLDLKLKYDPNKVTIVDVQAVNKDSGYNAVWKDDNGTLEVAFYGYAPLNTGSKVIAITVNTHGRAIVTLPRITVADANEGAIPMRIMGGTLKGPPALAERVARVNPTLTQTPKPTAKSTPKSTSKSTLGRK